MAVTRLLLLFATITLLCLPLQVLAQTDKPAAQETLKVLKFGRIPYLDPRKMVKDHEPLMEYLKEKLGVEEARLILAPNYEKLTEFLLEGKVDVAWHGTLAYPEAYHKGAGRAVLQPTRYGSSSYAGMIITRADSSIESLKDLKGKSFAYTDPESASGYYYPRLLMLQNGIHPDKDLSMTKNVRKHDNVLYAVLFKRFDAGAVYDDAREHLKNDEERNQLKSVARTADIQNEPLMVRKNLSAELADRFVDAMLTLDPAKPEMKKILDILGNVNGFRQVTDDDYKQLRADMEEYQRLLTGETATAETGLQPVQETAPAPTAPAE